MFWVHLQIITEFNVQKKPSNFGDAEKEVR